MLRDIAQGIADYITDDEILHNEGNITVVVEDKADIGTAIATAIGQLGVCVLIAVTGFRRKDSSPLIQGDVQIQISCYEHPSLNRDDLSTMTAQGVTERIAQILNYKKFPFLVGQMLFRDFSRDDVDEANIVRSNYEVHTRLGFEDIFFGEQQNS
jgi:hypothetical protein